MFKYTGQRNPRFTAFLLAGTGLVSLTPINPAVAQNAAPTPDATAAAQDIIVTGSRVIANGNNSPSPVTVIQTQDVLQLKPGTLADALNIMPIFSGSKGTGTNATTTGPAPGGNGNANQINLRDLDPDRTLVLLDGHRVPPTSYSNIVDVDIIPQMLIQRVDTVTGGVSAVYGSDAVAGVVNYIIDKKFEGIRVQGNSSISQLGDDPKRDIGIAVGHRLFGDRGHIEFSYQHVFQGGISAKSDRDYLNQVGMTGAGTAANPYVLNRNLRLSTLPFGGLITSGALANQAFASNGVLSPFQNGTPTGTSGIQIGGGGGYYDAQLLGKERMDQFFGRFDYDASDTVKLYVQASGTHKLNSSYQDALSLSNVTLSSTDAFLAPQYQQQLAAAGQSTFKLSQLGGNNTRLKADSISDQWIFAGGASGTILGNWHWGVDYSHGRSKLADTLYNNPDGQRVAAALDAVVNPANGQIVCNITLTNPNTPVAQGCVPYNPFGPTAASQAAINYMEPTSYYTAITNQDDVTGNISGSPFSTWAGPVTVALSGEWRRLGFSAVSSLHSTDLRNCTGLRFNCSPTQAISNFTFSDTPKISQTVSEGAVEAEVPLVKDVRFIQALNLNGAARYTHYDTSGSYWTWKIGGDWEVNDHLRFRATRSRDIRAPTLFELTSYATSPTTTLDLLTNQAPSLVAYSVGNPNLKAEIANTTTAGVVWRPARRLSFSVDAYSIKISNAITLISGITPAYQNLCYDSGGTSFFCTLQTRPGGFSRTPANMAASNAVTGWIATYLNFAEVSTKGIDFESNFSTTLFDRPASLRLLASYQPHIYYRIPGAPTIDQGDAAFGPTGYNPNANLRITGFARFQPAAHVTLDILEQWRNSMKLSGDPSVVIVDNHIAPFATTTVSLTFDVKMGAANGQIIATITNLLDATPPVGGYLTNGSRVGLRDGFVPNDDVVGRAFNVGFRAKF